MTTHDPADDRDEPTDDECSEAAFDVDDPAAVLSEIAYLHTDAALLAWCYAQQQMLCDLASEAKAEAKEE
jgi:hypothetical protein